MSVEVTLTSELRVPSSASPKLTAGFIRPWLSALPDDAVIDTVQACRGSQRDEYYVTVGLKATWKETR